MLAAFILVGHGLRSSGGLSTLGSLTRSECNTSRQPGLLEDPREFESTQRESDEAHQRGIRGVPVFVFNNDRFAVSGAPPESVFREAIQRTVAGASAACR